MCACIWHSAENKSNVFAGGKKFCTTIDTLTQREPDSMLAAMFSGRHTVCEDPETVFPCAVNHCCVMAKKKLMQGK